MMQTILDPCFFFKKKDGEFLGLFRTRIDDNLAAGRNDLSIEEQFKALNLKVKNAMMIYHCHSEDPKIQNATKDCSYLCNRM